VDERRPEADDEPIVLEDDSVVDHVEAFRRRTSTGPSPRGCWISR